MAKNYKPPQFIEIMASLSDLRLPWRNAGGKLEYWSVGDWGKIHRVEVVRKNRSKQNKIEIFNTFVSALLQGAWTRGSSYGQRIELMEREFHDLSDVTEQSAESLLRDNNYALMSRGVNITLQAKELFESATFPLEVYFEQAENKFEGGFGNDPFLGINGVGRKVRDFALSQFSLCYCAIDRHIADILTRTGLIIYGYGDLDFGTNQNDESNYKFMQRLVIRFAKETGWSTGSSEGWSPGAIDSSFWLFGQAICKGRPECYHCPINDRCLTFQNKEEQ